MLIQRVTMNKSIELIQDYHILQEMNHQKV